MFENLTGKGIVLFPAEQAGDGIWVPSWGVGEGEAREESGFFLSGWFLLMNVLFCRIGRSCRMLGSAQGFFRLCLLLADDEAF